MADTLVLTGCVTDQRKLKVRMRREVSQQLARWKPGTELTVTIERKRATRSLESNAYYWAVVVDRIAQRLEWTPDDAHFYLKARFLPKKLAVCDGNGEIVDEFVLGGSTAKLNKIEFWNYLDEIVLWAGEALQLELPPPDPAWRETRAEQAA